MVAGRNRGATPGHCAHPRFARRALLAGLRRGLQCSNGSDDYECNMVFLGCYSSGQWWILSCHKRHRDDEPLLPAREITSLKGETSTRLAASRSINSPALGGDGFQSVPA